jgi:hypothetical protein
MKLSAATKTFIKYALWTGVAAVIDYAAANIADVSLPTWAVPVMAAFLKSAATYCATQKEA